MERIRSGDERQGPLEEVVRRAEVEACRRPMSEGQVRLGIGIGGRRGFFPADSRTRGIAAGGEDVADQVVGARAFRERLEAGLGEGEA